METIFKKKGERREGELEVDKFWEVEELSEPKEGTRKIGRSFQAESHVGH